MNLTDFFAFTVRSRYNVLNNRKKQMTFLTFEKKNTKMQQHELLKQFHTITDFLSLIFWGCHTFLLCPLALKIIKFIWVRWNLFKPKIPILKAENWTFFSPNCIFFSPKQYSSNTLQYWILSPLVHVQFIKFRFIFTTNKIQDIRTDEIFLSLALSMAFLLGLTVGRSWGTCIKPGNHKPSHMQIQWLNPSCSDERQTCLHLML